MGEGVANRKSDARRRVRYKKEYLTRLLRKEGKYSPEMSQQVLVAAELMVHAEFLAEKMGEPGYSPVVEEKSREGYGRLKPHPLEKLYADYLAQAQAALRALGMNTDSKDRKQEADSFGEFMESLGGDD